MKHRFKILFVVLTVSIFTNCNKKTASNKTENIGNKEMEKPKFIPNEKLLTKHSVNSEIETENCTCSAQFDLKDSLKLRHIKNQFYKSQTGHLYEKTITQREINGHLADVGYFNGYFSQEVDPLSFEELDGWYAKDKSNVYYYRPTSGGMQISKLEKADAKTFKILKGHYKYASDKNYFYDEIKIIEGYKPSKTIFTFDNKKRATEMNCGNKKYKFEIVN